MNIEQRTRLLRLMVAWKAVAPAPKPVPLQQIVAMENDLTLFLKEAWKFLEPGRELTWSWHYDLICEYLTLVKQRKLRRLILNVPPRTAKSTIVTKCFPCWMWATDPTHEFLCASHSRDLSTDHSVARRNLLTSPWYRSLWGDKFQLASDRNLTTQFNNDHQGKMIATSTGSGAEGKGGDTAILDDPMSSEQSLSDVERFSANRWVSNTLKQRLNNPSTAAIVIIMQRLHELDTTGFVLLEEPGAWTHIVIPLEAEKDEIWEFPITGRVHYRTKGEVLQEERFTPSVVEEKKRNRLVFAGQYQQRPAPIEGNLIKRSEVRYFGGVDPLTGRADEPLPERFDKVLISADCAFKDLKTSDYVAVGTIGVSGRKRFVLNVVNEHLDAQGTEMEIRRQRNARPGIVTTLVEDKANGPAVIQRLKANVSGVIEIEPQGGKVARMFAVAPEWQAGDWYVDRTAAWCEPFLQQITMFPTAAHDDMCDMMTQVGVYLGGSANLATWANL
jgi:predicted phage terminase large subunit-like protein